jgi:hypothetical protein
MRNYFIGTFILIVAISKHLIILNEEILVACSFLAFLLYSTRTFSSSIEEALHARTIATEKELQHHIEIQLKTALELVSSHKEYKLTQKALHTISNCITNNIMNSTLKAKNQVNNSVVLGTVDRLNFLILQHEKFILSLQKNFVNNFFKKN